MEMPKKETLDKVLDYKVNYQDKETLEKVRELYDMSRSLLLDGYKNNKLRKYSDGNPSLEIKLGIKSTVKKGYSHIIISYDPSEDYFSIYAINWPRLPIFQKGIMFMGDRRLPTPFMYNGSIKKSLKHSVYKYSVMEVVKEDSNNIPITFYKPGKWEELLEKKYKEKMGEYIKSPVSPEARKQVAGQRPTVQIVDDEEASR